MRELTTSSQLFQSAVAAKLGLTTTELSVLTLLREGPRSAGQLAERTQLTTGAITRVLDGLEKRGYLTRGTDPDDRRRVVVSVVPPRIGEVGQAFRPMLAAAEAVRAEFSQPELGIIARYVARSTEMLREQTAALRGGPGPATTAVLEATLGASRLARLALAGGAHQIEIGPGADLTDRLYRGQFDGPAPSAEVSEQGGESLVRMRIGRRRGGRWLASPGPSRLDLSPEAAWAIDVRGGAHHLTIDAAELGLRSFSIAGGTHDLRLRLGRPEAVVPLSLSGGVHHLTISRPAGVRVDVRVRGGAGAVILDGRRHPPTDQRPWRSTDDAARAATPAAPHYELTVTGGAHRIRVEAG